MAEDNWPDVVGNLSRVGAVWKRMTRILSREGAEPRVSGIFFKAVIQEVLLLNSEAWLFTPRTGRALGGFHNQAVRRLMGWLPRRKPYRKLTYTSATAAR